MIDRYNKVGWLLFTNLDPPESGLQEEWQRLLKRLIDLATFCGERFRARGKAYVHGCAIFFFDEVAPALDAALHLQRGLSDHMSETEPRPELVSVIHHCEVILDDGNIYGDNVSIACVAADKVRKQEQSGIFLTTSAAEAVPSVISAHLEKTGVEFPKMKGRAEWEQPRSIYRYLPSSE